MPTWKVLVGDVRARLSELPNGTSARVHATYFMTEVETGVPSYDDKQAGAKLSQCLACGFWFWFTQQPAPDRCVACRERK